MEIFRGVLVDFKGKKCIIKYMKKCKTRIMKFLYVLEKYKNIGDI